MLDYNVDIKIPSLDKISYLTWKVKEKTENLPTYSLSLFFSRKEISKPGYLNNTEIAMFKFRLDLF